MSLVSEIRYNPISRQGEFRRRDTSRLRYLLWEERLRSFEIIAGLLLAAILFVVLKVIGLVVKFALIAAILGFATGILLARQWRR